MPCLAIQYRPAGKTLEVFAAQMQVNKRACHFEGTGSTRWATMYNLPPHLPANPGMVHKANCKECGCNIDAACAMHL